MRIALMIFVLAVSFAVMAFCHYRGHPESAVGAIFLLGAFYGRNDERLVASETAKR